MKQSEHKNIRDSLGRVWLGCQAKIASCKIFCVTYLSVECSFVALVTNSSKFGRPVWKQRKQTRYLLANLIMDRNLTRASSVTTGVCCAKLDLGLQCTPFSCGSRRVREVLTLLHFLGGNEHILSLVHVTPHADHALVWEQAWLLGNLHWHKKCSRHVIEIDGDFCYEKGVEFLMFPFLVSMAISPGVSTLGWLLWI